MKRILFPTDFSGNEQLLGALAFAKKIQGELILLHSYPVLPIDEQFFREFEMVY
jgi:hypothetical protein